MKLFTGGSHFFYLLLILRSADGGEGAKSLSNFNR